MTKEDRMKEMGLENETFDYALPQNWVNAVYDVIGSDLKNSITGSFVWLYDESAKMFGRPASLNFDGNIILSHLIHHKNLYLNGRYYYEGVK